MTYQKYPSDFLRRSIYFEAQAMATADRLAQSEGTTRSRLVCRAVEFYAANYQRSGQIKDR